MKKTFNVIITITLLLLLAACSTSTNSDSPSAAPPSDTPTPSPAATPEPAPEPTPEPTPEPILLLTVSSITFSDISTIESIKFVDEKGNSVSMPSNWDDWFENAVVNSVSLTGTMNMGLNAQGGYNYSLSNDSKMQFIFAVNDEEYPIGVCEGAQFAVNKTGEKYILLAEETSEISPPPSIEDNTDTAGANNNPIDEWFEDISWNGTEVQFTAKKEATIEGISVFVNDQEYPLTIIKNSLGNMKLPNGATATAGSKLNLSINNVIILEGTNAACEVDIDGKIPEQICIYLKGGEKLIKDL